MRKKGDTKEINAKETNAREINDYKAQIKKIRESLGMTQGQLGEMVDRTSRAIRQIENGEAFPRISTLQVIADALNADLTISLKPKPGIAGTFNEQPGDTEEEFLFPVGSDDLRIGEND